MEIISRSGVSREFDTDGKLLKIDGREPTKDEIAEHEGAMRIDEKPAGSDGEATTEGALNQKSEISSQSEMPQPDRQSSIGNRKSKTKGVK